MANKPTQKERAELKRRVAKLDFIGTRDELEEDQYNPASLAWRIRSKAWLKRGMDGPKFKYEDPQELWDACCEYFEWIENAPLWEAKLVKYKEHSEIERLPKMRAMTVGGLSVFLGITRQTWADYRKNRPEMANVIAAAEEIIFNQKFEGAAADMLNANIISRDLGLIDKQQNDMGVTDELGEMLGLIGQGGKKIHEKNEDENDDL